MEITFEKVAKGRGCSWVAAVPKRRPIEGPVMAAGGDLPHDLFTFVVEREADLRGGFWGTVEAGGVFKSMNAKITDRSKAVMVRNGPTIDEAETLVNAHYGAWKAGDLTDPPAIGEALDAMLDRWRALNEGEQLVVTW